MDDLNTNDTTIGDGTAIGGGADTTTDDSTIGSDVAPIEGDAVIPEEGVADLGAEAGVEPEAEVEEGGEEASAKEVSVE